MERRFDTPGHVRLTVDNAAGDVEVIGHGDRVTEVAVTALSGSSAELAEQARVEERSSDGVHQITVVVPQRGRIFAMHAPDVRVEVRVPHGSDLTVTTASADIELRGQFGTGELRTQSGEVQAQSFSGPVRVRTASGGVRLEEAGDQLRVESASGDLDIGQVRGRAVLRSASGDVQVGRAADEVSVQNASGDVRVDEALAGLSTDTASGDVHAGCVREGRVTIRSASGDVSVGVARGSQVHVDATSASGDMDSEIELEPTATGGEGGPLVTVTVQTVSGDVRLRRAG